MGEEIVEVDCSSILGWSFKGRRRRKRKKIKKREIQVGQLTVWTNLILKTVNK